MCRSWNAVKQDFHGQDVRTGSKVAEIKIPADVPPGPLRDYLEWLGTLHRRAGLPSLHKLAGALRCSRPTVQRLFQRYPANYEMAWQLIRYLAEHPIVPTRRSEQEWDELYAKGEQLLEAAKPADAGEPEEVLLVAHAVGTDAAGLPFKQSAVIPVPGKRKASSDAAKGTRSPAIGGSTFIHVMGPSAGPGSFEEHIDLMARLVDSGHAASADSFPVANQVFVSEEDPYRKVGRDIVNHFVRPEFVLAVFEGFRFAWADERGVFLDYATSRRPTHLRERYRSLSELLPKAQRAVVVLVGDKYKEARAEKPSILESIGSGFGEILLVEVDPREAMGDVLEGMLLKPSSRRGGPDALRHIADQAARLPDARRVLLIGGPIS